jgi:hypothetical protein
MLRAKHALANAEFWELSQNLTEQRKTKKTSMETVSRRPSVYILSSSQQCSRKKNEILLTLPHNEFDVHGSVHLGNVFVRLRGQLDAHYMCSVFL